MVLYMQMWSHPVNPPIVALLLWHFKLFEISGSASKLFSKLTLSLRRFLAYPVMSWHSQILWSTQRTHLHLLHSLQGSLLSFLCSFVLFSSLPEFHISLFDAILLLSLNLVNVISLESIVHQMLLASFALSFQRRVLLWSCLETLIIKPTASTISDPSTWLTEAPNPQNRQHPWYDLDKELCIQYPSNSASCIRPFLCVLFFPSGIQHQSLIQHNHS